VEDHDTCKKAGVLEDLASVMVPLPELQTTSMVGVKSSVFQTVTPVTCPSDMAFLKDQSSVRGSLSSTERTYRTSLKCTHHSTICLLTICNATAVHLLATSLGWFQEWNNVLPTSEIGVQPSD